MRQAAQMWRIYITPQNVRFIHVSTTRTNTGQIAKKEDDPEQALKEFKAIVEKEEEKGDW